jgi:putative SOS response-associated peptidase YedK
MCGRYVDPDEAAMERLWKIDRRNWNPFKPPRYNVAPSLQVAMIVRAADGATELLGARWGLIPAWWKQEKPPGFPTINARSEEAAEKPLWRNSLKSTRCIMPARGWYEWNEMEPVLNSSGRKANQPYFHFSPDDEVIAIAGLWSVWKGKFAGFDREPMMTCALMTKEAAPSVAHVHHRMPVILKPEHFNAWVDPRTSPDDVQAIIADARQDFACHRVSTRVGNVKNDSPDLIEPQGA